MQEKTIAQQCYEACNKLVKWRAIFCGWQLGTRPIGDPESDALRDHREATILLRAEVSALVRVLVDKHIFTEDEYQQALCDEAKLLDKDYERRFPGIKSTDTGMDFDVQVAAETMKGWKK